MIKEVKILKWCISCKNCESVCPEIFKVKDTSQVVSDKYSEFAKKIIQARDLCPVKVISVDITWDENYSLDLNNSEVVYKNNITHDVIELWIKTDISNISPWQYCQIKFEDKKWVFYRSYSVSYFEKWVLYFTIKILNNWRWSQKLLNLKINDKLNFFWPVWDFVLKNTDNKKIFIATWTWLAPVYNMILNTPENIEKKLIFWVKEEKDLFYLDKIKNIINLEIVICLSSLQEKYNWFFPGRVTNYLYEIWINDEVYICWNPDMVSQVSEVLQNKWVKNIYSEKFVLSNFIKNKTDIDYIKILNIFFIIWWVLTIPFLLFFDYYSISWIISWWSLIILMIIRPFWDLFPKILFFRQIIPLRKWLGILTSSIVLSHLLLSQYKFVVWFDLNFMWFIEYFFSYARWSGIWLIARVSEIIAIILLITSNNYSVKLLWKYWKKIQKLSYLYLISWGIYLWYLWQNSAYISMWVVFLLVIIAFLIKKFR